MKMHLQLLLSLCHKKNELNRRRRRFYYYWNGVMRFNEKRRQWERVHIAKHLSRHEAHDGYRKAQADMKAMTAEMRRLRVECGARFEWSDGGHIDAVRCGETRVDKSEFKRYHDLEVFETNMLAGG